MIFRNWYGRKICCTINVSEGKVSEDFDDISTYNQSKVVYAIVEDDGTIKIIVQDIYAKEDYYMEIARDYASLAVLHHVIANAAFQDESKLILEHYVGEDLEKVSEIIDLDLG